MPRSKDLRLEMQKAKQGNTRPQWNIDADDCEKAGVKNARQFRRLKRKQLKELMAAAEKFLEPSWPLPGSQAGYPHILRSVLVMYETACSKENWGD